MMQSTKTRTNCQKNALGTKVLENYACLSVCVISIGYQWKFYHHGHQTIQSAKLAIYKLGDALVPSRLAQPNTTVDHGLAIHVLVDHSVGPFDHICSVS